jgi:hypothetical protein
MCAGGSRFNLNLLRQAYACWPRCVLNTTMTSQPSDNADSGRGKKGKRGEGGQRTCAGKFAGAGRAASVLDGQHNVAAGGELRAKQAVRVARPCSAQRPVNLAAEAIVLCISQQTRQELQVLHTPASPWENSTTGKGRSDCARAAPCAREHRDDVRGSDNTRQRSAGQGPKARLVSSCAGDTTLRKVNVNAGNVHGSKLTGHI